MLELKQITKDYTIGKKKSKNFQVVNALKGIDLSFRQNEFVSILGASGCGKTTLLNIIGGLDKYTSGDLVIKGKSTKEFKDKDWDNYRNHSIGFVFQSYNLIHHQTILHNVELALTLSGVKRKERTKRALEALEKVGLKDRANNLPNQLSGGQMQRVAIARAIVNDPDIILADEPTGALDSKTSVQIMEILKELSKTKLVIMVTHNPDLAEEYSSRIVKMKDGDILDDSNPYTTKNKTIKSKNIKPQNASSSIIKKPKKRMSFWTALSLSFKNLLTKKARTILVSFAGSIGIIGIALILAVSSGFSGYMNKIQEDTLSSYPIVIEEQSVNYMNLMSSMFSSNNQNNNPNDAVYAGDRISSILDSFANSMESNDMKSFNTYLQNNYSKLEPYVNAIKYTYDLDLHIYNNDDTDFKNPISPSSKVLYNLIVNYAISYISNVADVNIVPNADNTEFLVISKNTPESLAKEDAFFNTIKFIKDEDSGVDVSDIYYDFKTNHQYNLTETELIVIIAGVFRMDINSYKNMDLGLFNEMIDNKDFVTSQYDLLAGNWNNDKLYEIGGRKYADTVLVLNQNNELDDYLLYALGLISETEMKTLFEAMMNDQDYTIKVDYNSILGKEFRVYLKTDTFEFNGEKYVQTSNKTPSNEFRGDYITLKISGIVKANSQTKGGALEEGLAYPKTLTDYCINKFNSSAPVTQGNVNQIDKSNPKKIAIYANSFDMKEVVESFISEYNAGVPENQKITYTDYMSLMMSAVSSIVDTVSYVLIAFVSVSLIVSSIMIGIITYISVLERTKEIGVLRSVGASKKDIKRVFTAESLIIGFSAGALGILITLLLCIPINIVFKAFTGISGLASLPITGGIILIGISMLLTFISGLIPAQVASKKDPVVALRTE